MNLRIVFPRAPVLGIVGPGLILSSLLVLACQPRSHSETYSPYLDTQLIATDGIRQLDLVEPDRGGVKAGRNWQKSERKSRIQRWTSVSGVSRAPSIYFSGSFADTLDVRFRCSPLGAQPQRVVPVINGHQLSVLEIPDGYRDLAFSIPRELLRSSVNLLEFRFEHEGRALSDAGVDSRLQSARFESLQLVPRGKTESLRAPRGFVLERGTIRLAAESPRGESEGVSKVAIPLPGTTEFALNLDRVGGGGEDSKLVIAIESSGESEVVWEGPLNDAAPVFHLEKPTTPARLILQHIGESRARPIFFEWKPGSIVPRGQRTSRGQAKPHVFIYLIDTLRADALSLYGAERPTSPEIEKFAQDSVTFLNAWSTAAWTLPSVMSTLSGVYPSRHGYALVRSRPKELRHPLLSTDLANLGYETVAISQSFLVSDVYGFASGFGTFYVNDALSRGTSESSSVLWFLWEHLFNRSEAEKPLFAYIHTVDPHQPYRPKGEDLQFARDNNGSLRDWQYSPEYFTERDLGSDVSEVAHMKALYDGEVLHADRQFGAFIAFLKYLGLYADSLIVLAADHGEEFAEHGGFGHGHSLFEEQVHVPLLIKFPGGREAGTQVEPRVSLVDIAPTILEVAGADLTQFDFDGLSLARPTSLDNERVVLAETKKKSRSRSVQVDLIAIGMGALKCVYGERSIGNPLASQPVFHVFDLATDPSEEQALEPDSVQAARCLAELRETLDADLSLPAATTEVPLSDEQRARLRSLGYLD